jgi:hypothetical protein
MNGKFSCELTFLFKNKVQDVSLIDIHGLKNGNSVVLFTNAQSDKANSFQ